MLIGWRSRPPIVAGLYRLGQIYLKPMDVKAKTVNVIDVHYLDYRRSSLGRVELTESPIDFRLAAPGNELAFRTAVDEHMATLGFRHPEIAADPLWEAEVRRRLEHRTREYPKQLREFQRYHYEGIRLEFGYDQQGLSGPQAAEVAELRRARVRSVVAQGDDGVTRRYLASEMDGPGNNGPSGRSVVTPISCSSRTRIAPRPPMRTSVVVSARRCRSRSGCSTARR